MDLARHHSREASDPEPPPPRAISVPLGSVNCGHSRTLSEAQTPRSALTKQVEKAICKQAIHVRLGAAHRSQKGSLPVSHGHGPQVPVIRVCPGSGAMQVRWSGAGSNRRPSAFQGFYQPETMIRRNTADHSYPHWHWSEDSRSSYQPCQRVPHNPVSPVGLLWGTSRVPGLVGILWGCRERSGCQPTHLSRTWSPWLAR